MSLTAERRQALIETYARGPVRLRDVLASVPAAALKWRPSAGQWSVHEIVCHCADAEANAHMRIRYLVGESSPVISGYDQDPRPAGRAESRGVGSRVGSLTPRSRVFYQRAS